MAVYKNIIEIIGNTPILKLDKTKTGLKNIDIYLKLEYMNPFGSLKDRTALGMLKKELPKVIKGKKELIEASSGNTIKALQGIGNIFDIKTTSVTNRIRIPEVKDILLFMGTKIIEVPGKSSCIDPSNPEDPLYIIEKKINQNKKKYIFLNQYYNKNNPKIHKDTTGAEISKDLGKVNYLFATLGTTGSSQGVFCELKKHNKEIKLFGVAAEKDDYIPGIRNKNDLMDVGIFDKNIYEEIIYDTSQEAINGMMELTKKFGVMAGPTSGALYKTAIKKLKKIDKKENKNKKAVLIICDRMEWYISYLKERRPEIFSMEPNKNSFKNYKTEDNKIKEINVNQLNKNKKENLIMIDIRSNLSYKMGHIPNSINITDTFLEEIIDEKFPFPKNKRIILICAKGNTSKRPVAYLNNLGYKAFSLSGGFSEWKKNNLKIEKITE